MEIKEPAFVPVFVLAVDRAARNATVFTVHNAQFYREHEPDLGFVFNEQAKSAENSKTEDKKEETKAE